MTRPEPSDSAFKARFQHEYETVARWCRHQHPFEGASVLDLGCGRGIAALRFALEHKTARVRGADIGSEYQLLPELAQTQIGLDALPANLAFDELAGNRLPYDNDEFDFVFSWSVFEHIRDTSLSGVVADLRRVMKPGAGLFVQIEPLYYSARGAHLYDALSEPWVHLLYQDDVLEEKLSASDAPRSTQDQLWQQYRELNRLTAPELTKTLRTHGFEVQRIHTTRDSAVPPERLRVIYQEDILLTNQLLLLCS